MGILIEKTFSVKAEDGAKSQSPKAGHGYSNTERFITPANTIVEVSIP